jgi:hypothetical protein
VPRGPCSSAAKEPRCQRFEPFARFASTREGRGPESRHLPALRRDRAGAAADAAGAHPANAVRLDLPEVQAGEEPDDRYRRAARTLSAWRSTARLRKDGQPSIYVYEQTYRVPGSDQIRTQRGFFGRLYLEDFVPGSGVLPHERTLSAPKGRSLQAPDEPPPSTPARRRPLSPIRAAVGAGSGGDRDRGARTPTSPTTTASATGCGPCPRTGRHAVREARCSRPRARSRSPSPTATTATRRRSDTATSGGPTRPRDGSAGRLRDDAVPRDDQAEADRPADPPRRARPGRRRRHDLLAHAEWLFEVSRSLAGPNSRPPSPRPTWPAGEGRFGLWTRKGGAILKARRGDFAPSLREGGAALHRLDVTLLQVALDRLCGIDAAAITAGRLAYTKSVAEALDWVDALVTAPTPRSCSIPRRSPRSRPSPRTATSCLRSRPTSTPRP